MAQSTKKTLEYFRDVVGLPAQGLDPHDLQDEHVTESECIEIWGPRRRHGGGFQLKNATNSDKSLQRRIEVLWSLIYQLKVSEFGLRFGMGVLAEKKGIPINWAQFALRREARLKPKGTAKSLKRKRDLVAIELDCEVPTPVKKANVRMENEKVGKNVPMSLGKGKSKEDGEKISLVAPRGFDVGIMRGDINIDNKKHLDVRDNPPNVKKETQLPATLKASLAHTNRNDAGILKASTSTTPHQRSGLEEGNERIILEENIEELLSLRTTCKAAIDAFNSLCAQKDEIDEAIVEAARRMKNAILCMKAIKGRVAVPGGNEDAKVVATKLEDATLWHDGLLEEKIATSNKIEAQLKNVEGKREQLKVTNEELLGLLLKHYQMFGKKRNIIDSMQTQLALLQNGLDELKTVL